MTFFRLPNAEVNAVQEVKEKKTEKGEEEPEKEGGGGTSTESSNWFTDFGVYKNIKKVVSIFDM